MKKRLLALLYGISWLITVCVGLSDGIFFHLWWKMRRYVEQYGAAENLRAAEDAELYGLFAVMLLVPFLCLLAALLLWRSARTQKLVKRSDENKTVGL